jgi:hypothetical protein
MLVSRRNHSPERRGRVSHQARSTNDHTPAPGLWARLWIWMRLLLDRLFAPDDVWAIQHGWEIERGRLGLSRTYRDPRFDTLASCGACHGRGWVQPGRPCLTCGGTGCVTLGSTRDDWRQSS